MQIHVFFLRKWYSTCVHRKRMMALKEELKNSSQQLVGAVRPVDCIEISLNNCNKYLVKTDIKRLKHLKEIIILK